MSLKTRVVLLTRISTIELSQSGKGLSLYGSNLVRLRKASQLLKQQCHIDAYLCIEIFPCSYYLSPTMYTVFVILHIISAGTWIGLGVVTVLLTGLRKKAQGTLGELYLIRAGVLFGAVMGNIGGIGILITGGAMAGIRYSWFPFSTLPWLAIKQTIFVILLIMTFAIMVPKSKKIRAMSGEELGGKNPGGGASLALRTMMDQVHTIGMFMQMLILTNIILGEWQPMLWVTQP